MRPFVDVRFYIEADYPITAESVARALGNTYSDVTHFRVTGFRRLDYGAESADGEVVRWNVGKERKH